MSLSLPLVWRTGTFGKSGRRVRCTASIAGLCLLVLCPSCEGRLRYNLCIEERWLETLIYVEGLDLLLEPLPVRYHLFGRVRMCVTCKVVVCRKWVWFSCCKLLGKAEYIVVGILASVESWVVLLSGKSYLVQCFWLFTRLKLVLCLFPVWECTLLCPWFRLENPLLDYRAPLLYDLE